MPGGTPTRVRSPNAASTSGLVKVGSEMVPDSEEERRGSEVQNFKPVRTFAEVIEISSDEESDKNCASVTLSPQKPSAATPQTPKKAARPPYNLFRRIIESSDEELEDKVIELTDSSDDDALVVRNTPRAKTAVRTKTPTFSPPPPDLDLDDLPPIHDESIIVFDEPRSARRPILIGSTKQSTSKASKLNDKGSSSAKGTSASPNKASSSSNPGSSSVASTPAGRRLTGKPPATPRSNSKKAQQLAKQKKLYEYAQEIFTELNESVFKEGLPVDTKLNWNNRLLTTAGRAKFHRSREGVQTTEIELAEKILDCEERIRNTLSHEMCHLATWTIDNKLDENHGRLFKKWANKVMKKHPDIHVSVKHDYEISYPFEWKCEKCAKIYGRFSKSIRPDECRCGACKEGKLIPLFASKKASSTGTPKLSKLAATKPQDSPRTTHDSSPSIRFVADTDSEEDLIVEILTKTLASTSITL